MLEGERTQVQVRLAGHGYPVLPDMEEELVDCLIILQAVGAVESEVEEIGILGNGLEALEGKGQCKGIIAVVSGFESGDRRNRCSIDAVLPLLSFPDPLALQLALLVLLLLPAVHGRFGFPSGDAGPSSFRQYRRKRGNA